MCSSSIFVRTAIVGLSCKKLLSYSSASTTIIFPAPNFELVSRFFTRPPTTRVGSIFAEDKRAPIIEEVDVFPCVPDTPILVSFKAISAPSISALLIIGILFFLASINSVLSLLIALE